MKAVNEKVNIFSDLRDKARLGSFTGQAAFAGNMGMLRRSSSMTARGRHKKSINQKRFWRDMVGVLVIKALGLAALYALFFSPSEQPILTTQAVAGHFIVLPSQSSLARPPEVNND